MDRLLKHDEPLTAFWKVAGVLAAMFIWPAPFVLGIHGLLITGMVAAGVLAYWVWDGARHPPPGGWQ